MAFEEDSLWDAEVLDFWLGDEDGLIREIVVNFYLSDHIVFESAFDHMLLEIAIESQNLPIILDPWRLNAGN